MASSATRKHLRTDRDHLAHCSSLKQAWRREADAFDAAEHFMTDGLVMPGCHITPYRCRECGDWHVYNRRIVFA